MSRPRLSGHLRQADPHSPAELLRKHFPAQGHQLVGAHATRHVIATLWSVHDHYAPTVADTTYQHLTTGHPDANNAAHAPTTAPHDYR